METIENKEFKGERPLYRANDLKLINVKILEGESALKETKNIDAENCSFEGKYPLWLTDGFKIKNCQLTEGARAGIWYSNDLDMQDTEIGAPKMFRDSKRLNLKNVKITNAEETFWHCDEVNLENVFIDNGPNVFMHCNNVKINNYKQNGKYSFQYCKNIEIHNAQIFGRDAFWNSENVTIYDSEIIGEYLAWHTKNVKFINCIIGGTQPLCYADGLELVNCRFKEDADLAFEYSDVKADVKGNIVSVKNPRTGCISADSIGEIIIDKNIKQPADCQINIKNK